MSKIEEIVASMSTPQKRYQLNMGAGKLAGMYKCTPEEVKQAKYIVRYGNTKDKKMPKVLIFDIETLPILSYTWGVWNVNISPHQIVKDWCMLSWSAKWLLSTEVYGDVLTSTEALNRNDQRIAISLWDLINEADIIVAHNGDRFDIKKMNTRFLQHSLPPPSLYRSIDTLKILKGFGHTYRRLDFVNKQLGLNIKETMVFNDWVECDNGDPEALEKMLKYNKWDVEILEETYLIVRPWMKAHPNLALFDDETKVLCPTCGSHNIAEDGHFYHTGVGKYASIRCFDCGAVSRSRTSELSKEHKSNLLSPVPK